MQSPATGKQMMYLTKPFLNYQAAEATGKAFAAVLSESGDMNLDELRRISARAIINQSKEEQWDVFYPVIDGHVLPKSPFRAFLEGDQAKVPVLLGSNSDEGSLIYPIWRSPFVEYRQLEPGEVPDTLSRMFGQNADKLMKLYPGLDAGSEKGSAALLGDYMFNAKTRFYAVQAAKAGQATFLYIFSRVPPSPKQTIGAAHAAEVDFVFDSHMPIFPITEEDKLLTEAIGRYWTNFAKSGDPNEAGLEEWPRFSAKSQMQMDLGYQLRPTPVLRADKFDILDQRLLHLIEDMRALGSE